MELGGPRGPFPTGTPPVDDAAVDERLKTMGLPGEVPWEAGRGPALAKLAADGAVRHRAARERPLVHITVPWADLDAGRVARSPAPVGNAAKRRMLWDGRWRRRRSTRQAAAGGHQGTGAVHIPRPEVHRARSPPGGTGAATGSGRAGAGR